MGFLELLLGYLINLASNERSAAIQESRKARIDKTVSNDKALKRALASKRSFREEMKLAAFETIKKRSALGFTKGEQPFLDLLVKEEFQKTLTDWLMAGDIEEGRQSESALREMIDAAYAKAGYQVEQGEKVASDYLNAFERDIFSNPTLAHWRHNLSLEFLREQVEELRMRAAEAVGQYPQELKNKVLERYADVALKAWDIIDLSNLPEGDVNIATQALLLRQLYVPLRVVVEARRGESRLDDQLALAEQKRLQKRRWEAGRISHLGNEGDEKMSPKAVPLGGRLIKSKRIVVLGDPGAGKTTLLRWMATAFLLRRKEDQAFHELPDVSTLGENNWIPVLIRCRDLGEADLCRSFSDFLAQHLKKTELKDDEARVMVAVVLDAAAKGDVLFLVDGLDEITNPKVRVLFCQELERAAARYPNAPFVVTSRIVGYRDMPYRMGSLFEHSVISDLTEEDKDLFAVRWIEVTEQQQTAAERAKRLQELKQALHSSDRIERLTGNPMLLTTLALVKRKVGRLPSRRNDLYREAVSVLLNFNPIHAQIDEREAVPQLEYIAYEMCDKGAQTLEEDKVLDLLERVRVEYPNIRPIRSREPNEFLRLLEARSSILIQSGGLWTKDRPAPVYEFRHLTFQEYLAARALVDGRFPGRDKTKSLAEQIAPLAGAVRKREGSRWESSADEIQVSDSWRETIRLCVAACPDDFVDDVILAVSLPLPGEVPSETGRPRAVLAAACLADEPNVSEDAADSVLRRFVSHVTDEDGSGGDVTSLDIAALELALSPWSSHLEKHLIAAYKVCKPHIRNAFGGLIGAMRASLLPDKQMDQIVAACLQDIRSNDPDRAILAALTIMEIAYSDRLLPSSDLAAPLLDMLERGSPQCHAAGWALGWFCSHSGPTSKALWHPNRVETLRLMQTLRHLPKDEDDTRRWLISCLEQSHGLRVSDEPDDQRLLAVLLESIEDEDSGVRHGAAEALSKYKGDSWIQQYLLEQIPGSKNSKKAAFVGVLGQVGDRSTVEVLLGLLSDESPEVQRAAIKAVKRWKLSSVRTGLIRLANSNNEYIAMEAASALSEMGGPEVAAAFLELIKSSSEAVQEVVMDYLADKMEQVEKRILSKDFDDKGPWILPGNSIDEIRLDRVADELGVPISEVKLRAKKLADQIGLQIIES